METRLVKAFLPKKVLYLCFLSSKWLPIQARVQGGGPRGLGPPPRNWKAKKKKKKVIRANIKLFHLYFATFLVEIVIFSASF